MAESCDIKCRRCGQWPPDCFCPSCLELPAELLAELDKPAEPEWHTLRPEGEKQSHFFPAGWTRCLCGAWSTEDTLVDPRAVGELARYNLPCWKRLYRFDWLRKKGRQDA